MVGILESAVMTATKQVSHTGNGFLLCIFQINLQILPMVRRRTSRWVISLVMSYVVILKWMNWSYVLVLKTISALWENIEVKSSGRELILVVMEVKCLAKSHCEWSCFRVVCLK